MLRGKRRITAFYLFAGQQQSDKGSDQYEQQQEPENSFLKVLWLGALGVVTGQLGRVRLHTCSDGERPLRTLNPR